ncbi:MAG: RNA-directed DNA polymerase [Acidobacteria bacterium]|nr:RNA-directed DNA polymerase [Acidobacteriota bacterium]
MNKKFVIGALLQQNFFPAQKAAREELPPVFSSESFTEDAARAITNARQRGASRGWDTVSYMATHFSGVPRCLSIPHPLAYAHLTLCIHENWEKLAHIAGNRNSCIRPRQHRDGRLIVMDYESSLEKSMRNARFQFGMRFLVHTDISNFFPSVYSHAIPWATVGFGHAKSHRSTNEWFNQLDQKARWLKRNETQGVPIGPATSNILAEIILFRVDDALRKEGFRFERFIDDYTAYCPTEEKARDFIRSLSENLSQFKLLLNTKKTQIRPLPTSFSPDWIEKLRLSVPVTQDVNEYQALSYLSLATSMAKEEPDGSVLKYALKTILGKKLRPGVKPKLLPHVLALAFHQPALLPLCDRLIFRPRAPFVFQYQKELQELCQENARLRRSDGTSWALYFLAKTNVSVTDDLATGIINSRDCIPILQLYLTGNPAQRALVVDFANSLDRDDLYEMDQYWLLLYQLFVSGEIPSFYANEDAFDVLRAGNVSFIA